MNIINCTPHEICVVGTRVQSVYHPEGENWWDTEVKYPTSGNIARVSTEYSHAQTVEFDHDGYYHTRIEISNVIFGEIEDLPAPAENTLYIVSGLVLSAAKESGRTDCIAPRTSDANRDPKDPSKIISVKGFIR